MAEPEKGILIIFSLGSSIGLNRTDQNLGGDTQLLVQTADHVDRQSTAPVQHLSHSGSGSQYSFQVLVGQTLLLHTELDSFNRVRWVMG